MFSFKIWKEVEIFRIISLKSLLKIFVLSTQIA